MPRLTDQQRLELAHQLQQQVAKDPHRFAVYENDPVGFCRNVLGIKRAAEWPAKYFPNECGLWSKQQDVLKAAATSRRVVVRSGHSCGKSFVVACLVLWWLYARKGLVITTAPAWSSVEGIIWREIAAIASRAPVTLPGTQLETERKIDNTWYAIGLSTNSTDVFQGKHHPRLLVVVDEAPGVPENIHLAILTLATDPQNCVVMIGNPTSLSGTFYDAFRRPHIWTCLHISCFDHPNIIEGKQLIAGAIGRQQIEEWREQWGETHPFWAPRVLGEFPRISTRGIIPLAWVERAQNEEQRTLALAAAQTAKMPRIGGLDVARYGENACVLTIRHGDAVESIESWHHLSLMETCGRAVRAIADHHLSALVVDASGLGAGVVDRLLEQRQPVYAYNGGHRAFTQSTFTNRRTEMWWHLRERFEKERLWLPRGCDKLVGELVTPEYSLQSSGRIRAQTKEDLLKEGKPSPDFADSLVLCFAMDLDPLAEPRPKPAFDQDPTVFAEMIPVGQDVQFGQLPGGAF